MCGILFLHYNLTYSSPLNATMLGITTFHLILCIHYDITPQSHYFEY